MIRTILLAISVNFLTSTLSAQDNRYRTYGEFTWNDITDENFGCQTPVPGSIAFRDDLGPKADFITVGKLDGNPNGIFKNINNFDKIAAKFAFLVDLNQVLDTRPCLSKGTGCSPFPRPPYRDFLGSVVEGIKDASGNQILVPNDLSSTPPSPQAPFPFRSKESLLDAQFQEEAKPFLFAPLNLEISAYITNLIRDHIAFMNSKGVTVSEIVFQVANEPNLFPYIPPGLYAKYYLQWHRIVKNTGLAYNALNGTSISFKVMPGGLWIFEGLPDVIADPNNPVFNGAHILNTNTYNVIALALTFISQPADPRPISPPISNTFDYIQAFSAALQQQSGQSIVNLVDKWNLHFYPYVWKYFDSQNPRFPTTWTFTPIDITNAGKTSTSIIQKLALNLANLEALLDFVRASSKDKDIWLTEFGNINPVPEELFAPILSLITQRFESQTKGLSRWYYYKSEGEDSKLDRFNDIIREYDEVIGDFFSGFEEFIASPSQCPDPVTSTGALGVLFPCLIKDFSDVTPAQGLRKADKMRAMGRQYITKATGNACVNDVVKPVRILSSGGTERASFQTIEAAIASVNSNETIEIHAGRYSISSTADISGSGKTGITIRAKPGAHIVIEDGRFVLLPSNANLPLTNTINTNRIVLDAGSSIEPPIAIINSEKSVTGNMVGLMSTPELASQKAQHGQTISLGIKKDGKPYSIAGFSLTDVSLIGDLGPFNEKPVLVATTPATELNNQRGFLIENIIFESRQTNQGTGTRFLRFVSTGPGSSSNSEFKGVIFRNVSARGKSIGLEVEYLAGTLKITNCLFIGFYIPIDAEGRTPLNTDRPKIVGNNFSACVRGPRGKLDGAEASTVFLDLKNCYFGKSNDPPGKIWLSYGDNDEITFTDPKSINDPALTGGRNIIDVPVGTLSALPETATPRPQPESPLIDAVEDGFTDIGDQLNTVVDFGDYLDISLVANSSPKQFTTRNGIVTRNDFGAAARIAEFSSATLGTRKSLIIDENLVGHSITLSFALDPAASVPILHSFDIAATIKTNGFKVGEFTYYEAINILSENIAKTFILDSVSPAIPRAFIAQTSSQDVSLSWVGNLENDLFAYNIFRSAFSPVPIEPGNLIASLGKGENSFVDGGALASGNPVFYAIISVDSIGNISGPAEAYPAAYIYVDDQGSDRSGTGSFGAPFKSIGRAYRQIPHPADQNHVISIMPGFYNEMQTIKVDKIDQFSASAGLQIEGFSKEFSSMPTITVKKGQEIIAIKNAGSTIRLENLQFIGYKGVRTALLLDRDRGVSCRALPA